MNEKKANLTKGNAKNRLAFVKDLREACLSKYAEMPTKSIYTMREKYNVDLNFTNFLFNNKYFLRKRTYNPSIGVNCYVYRWNGYKRVMQLKKIILEADDSVVKSIKTNDNKQKIEKLEPIKEKKEYRSKTISILWGLIKITNELRKESIRIRS